MSLSKEIKDCVEEKISDCLTIAQKHFKQMFAYPTIVYKNKGTIGGTANVTSWTVTFNSILLKENVDDFIATTVPHEIAHLITYAVYGYNRRLVKPHGHQWKFVMRVLGVSPDRCHDYDTTNVQKKIKNKFAYKCNCERPLFVGPVVHRNIQRDMIYKCRRCKSPLSYIKPMGQVSYSHAREQFSKTTTKQSRVGTKVEQAQQLVRANISRTREQVIDILMHELNMSRAGATTYFYNARKQIGV